MTTSFTQLDVWKKAHQAVLETYVLTRRFPPDERFGLSIQIRKAAYPVPANISEGYGRRAPKEKAHFYTIAAGSAEELKYFLILSKDLRYVATIDSLWRRVEDVSMMLRRLIAATLGCVRPRSGESPAP